MTSCLDASYVLSQTRTRNLSYGVLQEEREEAEWAIRAAERAAERAEEERMYMEASFCRDAELLRQAARIIEVRADAVADRQSMPVAGSPDHDPGNTLRMMQAATAKI
jgi:hypothetical protein